MDFKQLFETQLKLDYHIKKEKDLHGAPLTENKILALLVEIGEMANEWRGFKFWSNNQEPRTKLEYLCPACEGAGSTYTVGSEHLQGLSEEPCEDCDGKGVLGEKNPLLEEYVDVLHFLLSIGNDIGYTTYTALKPTNEKMTVQKQILELYDFTAIFMNSLTFDEQVARDPYQELFNRFLNLGQLIGFTNEQITNAYYNKNETNHERQDNGY
jgi:dimeric dUTPase (all-alpha-NTP-PPase superfamily)